MSANTIRATTRHYGSEADFDIDTYDSQLVVERDADIIRIETHDPFARDDIGQAGVSIELSVDDAIGLMAALSEATMPLG